MEAAICDWESELKNRRQKKQKYSEKELTIFLSNLVQTLSKLQQLGISHRDIKPSNILCFKNGILKISDFGEAKNKIKTGADTLKQTLRGTELYMSPILYNSLKNHKWGTIEYNAYKNDVFSLGICFMIASCIEFEEYKILLEIRETKNMEKMNNILNKYLAKNFSNNYINILHLMLQIEEAQRPDFIELNSLIKYNLCHS